MADSLNMKLEVRGEDEVKKMLAGVGLDVKDLRGAMDDVGSTTIKYFSGQVFASRGGVIGHSWPRLSDRYAATKAKRFPGRPLLVQTGRMQGSFVKRSAAMSVEITNNDPKFKYHQSSASRTKLPRRAMIGIYNGMQDDVTKTIALALSRKIKKRTG